MLAVVGGGCNEGHTVFRRCSAPEKMRIVPFGKLRVNSLEATTVSNGYSPSNDFNAGAVEESKV